MTVVSSELSLSPASDPALRALETLERRVQDLVTEILALRAALGSAERDAAGLRDQLAERDERIAALQDQADNSDAVRSSVTERIEALLDRIREVETGE